MKRIISLILAVALILSIAILPAVASDKPDVKLDIVGFTYEDGTFAETTAKESYSKGDKVAVRIQFVNDGTARNVAVYDFLLAYDATALKPYTVDGEGPAISPDVKATVDSNSPEQGKILIGGYNCKTKIGADATATLVWVMFTVENEASAEEIETGKYAVSLAGENNGIEFYVDDKQIDSELITGIAYTEKTAQVPVTGALPTLASVSMKADDEGGLDAVYGQTKCYTLTALSTKGKDISGNVTWSVSPSTTGLSIVDNKLTVSSADAGEYTVTATPNEGECQGNAATATFKVTPATITNPTVTITGFGKGQPVTDAKATAANMTVACGWYTGEGTPGEDNVATGKFAADSPYTLTLILTPSANYKLADDMTVTVKGLGDDQVIEHATSPVIVKARTTAKDKTSFKGSLGIKSSKTPYYGDTLSQIELDTTYAKAVADVNGVETEIPGSFTWKDPTEKVGDAGGYRSHTVVFTPSGEYADLYEGFDKNISFYVQKKVLNISDLTWTWSDDTLTYTGEPQSIEMTIPTDIAEYVNVTYDNETEGHTNTAINAGSYTAAAVVTPKDANNISLGGATEAEQNSRTITKEWTIANADLNPTTAAKNVRFGTNKTVVVTPADFGLDQDGVEITSAVVDSTDPLILNVAISKDKHSVTFRLKDTVKKDAEDKLSGTATLKFAAENYNETTGTTLTINIIDKNSQTLTITGPETASFPYGTTEDAIKSALTITGLPTGATPEYRFSSTGSISTAVPGSYTLTVSYEDDNNVYTGTYTFEITKLDLKDATIEAANTLTYTGSEQTQNVTVKYNGTTIDASNYTVTNNKRTDAGTQTLTVTANADSTLYTGSKTFEFTIAKATPTADDFTVTVPTGAVYNGNAQPAIVTKLNNEIGIMTVLHNGDRALPKDAGEYTVTIDVAASDNYNAATGLTKLEWKFTIAKATPTLEIETAADATYTGQPYDETSKITLTSASNVSVNTYLYYSDKNCTVEATPVNVGTYWVKAKFNGDTNHNAVTSAAKQFKITKASYSLAIEAASVEYNKTPYSSSNIKVTPNLSVTFTYYSDAECTKALATAPTEAGTYYVKANYAGAANYNEATSNAASFEIKKATPATPPEIKVDGGDKKLSDLEAGMKAAMGNIAGTFEWYDSNGKEITEPDKTTIEANKEYTWKFIPADPNNYNSIEGKATPYVRDDLSWLPGVLGGGSSFSFHDVTRFDYYYDSVKWAADNGIASGTSRFTFSPDAVCTRAQTVTFLWRAAGSPLPRYRVSPFTDVHSYDYYYEAVLWAVEQGITTGLTATTFGPDETVTRGQVATFLYRAASAAKPNTFNPFTDVEPTAYNYDAILWAYDNRITTGTSTTTFSPDAFCTRAQIVTFLYRYYQGR